MTKKMTGLDPAENHRLLDRLMFTGRTILRF
jgi:hypothetical protein